MCIRDRVLSVLSCSHTGDVLIDPPWHLTREMIAALNIAVVAHGTTHDENDDGGRDPYEACQVGWGESTLVACSVQLVACSVQLVACNL